MRLLIALLAATAAYLLVTAIFDHRRPRPARQASSRRNSRVGLQQRLDQVGAGVTARRYRATVAGAMTGVAVVLWASTGTGALAVPPALAVGMLPKVFYQHRYSKVIKERRAAWPEAIRDVLAHIAVGSTLQRSLTALGTSGPLPLRETFQRFERNAAALDVPTALELVRAELADPVADHVIEAFIAAHEHGREVIVAVLRSLADNVTRDLQLVEQITTSQTESRLQAAIAGVLPFFVLAYLVTVNPGYREFYRTPAGWVVVSLGVLMAVGGFKLLTVLGRIPGDERVLVNAAKMGER